MKIGVQVFFDCLLDVHGQKYLMHKGVERVELEVEQQEQVCLLFYPTERGQIAYTAILKEFEGKLLVSCPYASVLEVGTEQYELEFAPFEMNVFPKKLSRAKQSGNDVWLVMGKQNYFCVGNDEMFFHTFEGEVMEYDFLTVFNKPALKVTQKDQEQLFVFCAERQEFDSFAGQISVGETIEVTTPCHDYAGQAHAKTFVYEGDQLVCQSDELLFLHQNPFVANNPQVIPFAFFEAIREQNFLLAKNYLSPALASKVSMEMLQEYFGEFNKIKPYNFFKDKGYYVCVVNKEKAKVFRIKMLGNKIDEMEQIHPQN